MTKKIITVLEITQTHIKLTQAQEEAQDNVITKIIVEHISSNTDGAISKALSDLIKKSNIKPTNLITVIPRNLVTVRNITFPSGDPAEIEKMVKFQAARQIPYSKEDIIVDYSIINRDSSGGSQVLLAIAHKDVINRYLRIIEGAGLKASLFALSSQGVCCWFKVYQDKNKKTGQEAVALVDIDTDNTDICFVCNNQLTFSRSISFGIKNFSGEDFKNLLQQIRLTLSAYKKERIGKEISRIIFISSSNKSIQGLAKIAGDEFSVSTEIIELQSIASKKEGLSLPNQIVQFEISSSAILGFALSRKESFIDLLPADIHKEQKTQIKNKELIISGVFLFLVIVSILSIVFVKLHKKEQYIKILEVSLKQTNPEAEDISQMIRKLDILGQRVNPKVSSIDILYELYNLMPKNMSLSALNLDEQGNLSLQGAALVMSDVFNFQSLLNKSEYFSNVEVKYASKKRMRKGELTDFRIDCQIIKQ